MNTNTKIWIARQLSTVFCFAIDLLGKDVRNLSVTRNSIRWCLDLKEGIDLSIFLLGYFESKTIKVLQSLIKNGNCILDIGANIGSLSLPMAQSLTTGKVFAIEPTQWAYQKLKHNIELNPALSARIHPIQAMIGESKENLPDAFYSSWTLESGQEAHSGHGGILQPAGDCSFYRLDDLVLSLGISQIDLIKLDVDGFETEVLKSGEKVFKLHRPKLIIELSPHQLRETRTSLSEVISLLREYGYSKVYNMSYKEVPFDASLIENELPPKGGENFLFLYEKI